MKHEEDFATDGIVNLKIEGYTEGDWKYKPTNAGIETDWMDQYIVTGKDGTPKPDFAKLNKLKLANLIAVPYDKENINKVLKIDKSWEELNVDQRWVLLSKLRGSVFDKILLAIKNCDKGDMVTKKK